MAKATTKTKANLTSEPVGTDADENAESTGQEATPPATAEPVTEPVEENNPFDPETILADDDDDEPEEFASEPAEEESATPPAETPPEEAAAEATPPEGETPPAEPTPAAPSPPEPAPVQQAAEPPQPAEPAEPAKTPEQLQQELNQWRETAETQLAEQNFALSEEDAAAITADPGKVLPRMAARVYMEAALNVTNAVMQQLPAVIEQTLAQRTERTDLEKQFFATWPALEDKAHMATLNRIGPAYRQMNPQATPEEFIRDVGAQAMVIDKVPLEEAPAANGAAEPAERQIPPHPPVNSAGRAPPAQPSGQSNPFALMADQVLREDIEE